MFNDTITLFNLHNGVWFPHLIYGADAAGMINGSSATALNGTTNADSGTILIQTNNDLIIHSDKKPIPYVTPKAYAALENGADAITFQPQTDFIFIGAYESTEPIIDDDYEAGFYTEMNSKNDDVYLITSVKFYGLIPHFEIEVR